LRSINARGKLIVIGVCFVGNVSNKIGAMDCFVSLRDETNILAIEF
jgi:hypothetical protein